MQAPDATNSHFSPPLDSLSSIPRVMDVQVQPPPENEAYASHGIQIALEADPTLYPSALSGWEHIVDWSKVQEPLAPATPSYQSFRSVNSDVASIYSTFDEEFDAMNPPHSAGSYLGPDSSHAFPASDDPYNALHFGTSGLGLVEDHYDQPNPNFEITTDPSPTFNFGHPRSPSPGSSPGDYDQSGPRSRASSVSSYHSYHDYPSPAHSFTELQSFASLNVNSESHPSSPSPYLQEMAITVSANAPSPPPSSTTAPGTPANPNAKILGRPLIIPPTPSINTTGFNLDDMSQATPSQMSEMKTAQPAASSSFLFPPPNPSLPTFSLPGGVSELDAGGPSIRLIPSTPVSAGGAPAAAHGQSLQPSGNTSLGERSNPASAHSSSVLSSAWPVPPTGAPTEAPAWSTPEWEQNVSGMSYVTQETPAFGPLAGQAPNLPASWMDHNSLGPPPQAAFPHGGHRRSASHSGTASRPMWNEGDASFFHFVDFQGSQGTVDPNEVLPQHNSHQQQQQQQQTHSHPQRPTHFPDPRSLDSLLSMSPDPEQSFRPPLTLNRETSPDMRLLSSTRPPSPLFSPQSPSIASFGLGGPSIRRSRSSGSTHSHRRGTKSEDISRGVRAPIDQEAFIRSITSHDGSLMAPDLRSPPPGSGFIGGSTSRRRGSASSSVSGTNDRASPYSRPTSMSPQMGGISLPDTTNNGGRVGRPNVTSDATLRAAAHRRKNDAPFKCNVPGCGSTFTRAFNLKGHLRSHREERPFACEWPGCRKSFARRHDCKRHQLLHLNLRPHQCQGCGKTFARMDALNRHHKTEGGVECRQFSRDGTSEDDVGDDGPDQMNLVNGGELAAYLNGTSTSTPSTGWSNGSSPYVA